MQEGGYGGHSWVVEHQSAGHRQPQLGRERGGQLDGRQRVEAARRECAAGACMHALHGIRRGKSARRADST